MSDWVGVANALYNSNLALVIEPLHWAHVGVKADRVIELQGLLFRHMHRRAVVHIVGVGKGHYSVDPVVASGQLQDHQYRVFLNGSHSAFSSQLVIAKAAFGQKPLRPAGRG